jgi:defect-in-organelle-trafficking protein DotC
MNRTALTIGFTLLAFCAGCTSSPKVPRELIKISALKQGRGSEIANLRQDALRDTAIAVGAQGGLAWRAERIDCVLKQQQNSLNKIYNFSALLLNKNILPPVLEEGRDAANIANCETIRAADVIYRIITAPCFVSLAPTWRQYLWMHYEKPEDPNATLLPKNRAEAAIWNCYVREGWQKGVDQADRIFQANLNRLNRDFKGMILYHKLYSQNMVSAPFVAQADLGVTGDDREMRVNDRVLRITDTARLNVNSKSWQAAVQKQRREMPVIEAPDESEVKAMVTGRKSFKSEVYSQPIDLKYGK